MKKNKFTKAIVLGLGIALFFGPVVASAQIASWAKPAYQYLDSKKIIPVKLKDVDYTKKITRLEFTHLLITYLMSNKSYSIEDYSKSNYKDINDKFVNLASNLGVASGYSDGTFKPELYITRAEAASIAFRVEKLLNSSISGTKPSSFSDKKFIPTWAADSVGYMSKNGIMSGFPDGTFKPSQNITRQEALVLTENLAKSKSSTALTDIYDFVKDDEYLKKSEYEFILSNIPADVKFSQDDIKQAVFDTEKNTRQHLYDEFMNISKQTKFNAKTSPNLAFSYDMSHYIFGIESRVNSLGKTEQRIFMATLSSNGKVISVENQKSFSSWFTVQ